MPGLLTVFLRASITCGMRTRIPFGVQPPQRHTGLASAQWAGMSGQQQPLLSVGLPESTSHLQEAFGDLMRACSRLSSTCGGHQHCGRASLPSSSPVTLELEAVEDEQDRLSREVAQLKVQR